MEGVYVWQPNITGLPYILSISIPRCPRMIKVIFRWLKKIDFCQFSWGKIARRHPLRISWIYWAVKSAQNPLLTELIHLSILSHFLGSWNLGETECIEAQHRDRDRPACARCSTGRGSAEQTTRPSIIQQLSTPWWQSVAPTETCKSLTNHGCLPLDRPRLGYSLTQLADNNMPEIWLLSVPPRPLLRLYYVCCWRGPLQITHNSF